MHISSFSLSPLILYSASSNIRFLKLKSVNYCWIGKTKTNTLFLFFLNLCACNDNHLSRDSCRRLRYCALLVFAFIKHYSFFFMLLTVMNFFTETRAYDGKKEREKSTVTDETFRAIIYLSFPCFLSFLSLALLLRKQILLFG